MSLTAQPPRYSGPGSHQADLPRGYKRKIVCASSGMPDCGRNDDLRHNETLSDGWKKPKVSVAGSATTESSYELCRNAKNTTPDINARRTGSYIRQLRALALLRMDNIDRGAGITGSRCRFRFILSATAQISWLCAPFYYQHDLNKPLVLAARRKLRGSTEIFPHLGRTAHICCRRLEIAR